LDVSQVAKVRPGFVWTFRAARNDVRVLFGRGLSEKPGPVIARRNDEAIQEQATTWIASSFLLAMTATFETVVVNSFFEALLNVLSEQSAYPGNSLPSVIANAVKQSRAGTGWIAPLRSQ
jgi:hypothetical protein